MRALLLASLVALSSCGGDRVRPAERSAASRPRSEATSPDVEEAAPEVIAAAEPEPTAPSEPDFDAPLPEEPCAPTRVRLAHRSAEALPPLLTHAVALRSEDGRHVRIVLSDSGLERDALGRFVEPSTGRARFEFDAVRRRRRPLEPGVLGPPDSLRHALTHVRIVAPGPLLTFGHRDIGRVELTEVGAERVCGRVELDDGFGRVRGVFTAIVEGTLPN